MEKLPPVIAATARETTKTNPRKELQTFCCVFLPALIE
jgi:hypothetical protein